MHSLTAPGVLVTPYTANAKLTNDPQNKPAHSVYRSGSTCPPACPLMNACYGKTGAIGIHTKRVTTSGAGIPLMDIYTAEANLIRKLPPIGLLRGSVFGDVLLPEGARLISAAQKDWSDRAKTLATNSVDGTVINYTHVSEAVVSREDWAGVSILRSVETPALADSAMRAGFGVAAVVATFTNNGKAEAYGKYRGIPCPAQVHGNKVVSCYDCGMCGESDRLNARGDVILFAAHGARKRSIPAILEGVNNAC